MNKCKECGISQPKGWMGTIHLEDCPNHDVNTCLACKSDSS